MIEEAGQEVNVFCLREEEVMADLPPSATSRSSIEELIKVIEEDMTDMEEFECCMCGEQFYGVGEVSPLRSSDAWIGSNDSEWCHSCIQIYQYSRRRKFL
jgi:hypothetical protein